MLTSSERNPTFHMHPFSNGAEATGIHSVRNIWENNNNLPAGNYSFYDMRNQGLFFSGASSLPQTSQEIPSYSSADLDEYTKVRRPKRPASDAVSTAENAPSPKQRITEQKMIARLRNFHITSGNERVAPGWFFMQRPEESFNDLETLMSSDEEESTEDKDQATDVSLTEETLQPSQFLQELLADDRKRLVVTPETNLCTDVVLWKPPEDLVSALRPKIDCRPVSPANSENDCSPVVTFPDSPTSKQPPKWQRWSKNARTSSVKVVDLDNESDVMPKLNGDNAFTSQQELASMDVD